MIDRFLNLMNLLSLRIWNIKFKKLGNVSDRAMFYKTVSVTVLNHDKDALNIGAYTHIRGRIFLYHHGKLCIGDDCYVGENTNIWSAEQILIGNRVLIAHNVNIADNTSHPVNALERHEHYKAIISGGFPDINLDAKPIMIKDDAWINENAVILRGITVGKGAIVGAGSVITHDVPDFTLVAGNPAKVIKKLYEW